MPKKDESKAVGENTPTLHSLNQKMTKLNKKKPITIDDLNSIITGLQKLNPLGEDNAANHSKMKEGRTKLYNQVTTLANSHGLLITLTNSQKTDLKEVGVDIPPTWLETLSSQGDYYAGIFSTAASSIGSNVGTLVNNAGTLAQSTTTSASALLTDAATAAQQHTNDLIAHAEKFTNSVSGITNKTLKSAAQSSKETAVAALAGISSAANGVTNATNDTLKYARELTTTAKTAVTVQALNTTLNVGAFILLKLNDLTVTANEAADVFNSLFNYKRSSVELDAVSERRDLNSASVPLAQQPADTVSPDA
ncbi:MAG TPA: hypothetical protein DDY37_08095, partial [Legionella sp.]|nr:hypothetical protein [Legionella sp.]